MSWPWARLPPLYHFEFLSCSTLSPFFFFFFFKLSTTLYFLLNCSIAFPSLRLFSFTHCCSFRNTVVVIPFLLLSACLRHLTLNAGILWKAPGEGKPTPPAGIWLSFLGTGVHPSCLVWQ
ncbi:uncharacterized protein BJX67DRAFT_238253 [Aspergillus lucknowensis]|uniref:Uncharacterized protein n=1 Tax=Aspergillus lucknowensis TaxID=176173 RepID=A0ABR4LGT0_9EURO